MTEQRINIALSDFERMSERIAELETQIDLLQNEIFELRKGTDSQKVISELMAQVAALKEIAEEERGRALWFVGDDPEHPENLEWAAEPNRIPESVRRLWINAARRQLSEEHPGAFR